MLTSPAFGEADLSNCERESIHLAGSIQPQGALLVVHAEDLRIVQASDNAALLGTGEVRPGAGLQALGGTLAADVTRLRPALADTPQPFQCRLAGDCAGLVFEGMLHRHGDFLVIELECPDRPLDGVEPCTLPPDALEAWLSRSIAQVGESGTITALADFTVRAVRSLTGYDRVMVYKFDGEGHGQVISEARDDRLEALLGHRYPATDIPRRARELYLRNRVRVLVDARYTPVPLAPRLINGVDELDMSHCHLRSMSPLHLQYLRNMGVTATLVASLVHNGSLWGLIAAHHYQPRNLRFALRASVDLFAEVVSTRIAAIEHYAHAHVALLVRRLEQRLIEATSSEGDWRLALFRNPRTILEPLEASGVVLYFDDDIHTAGEVPSTPELRALQQWIMHSPDPALVRTHSIQRASPALSNLTPLASGVLAVRLSASRPDYLVWLRKEQLQNVVWAGDPNKAVIGNDPRDLSPRRSFAAWSELVRGTALPWTDAETGLAQALGSALTDIILQVNAVRLLVVEQQRAQVREAVQSAHTAILVADSAGQIIFCNLAMQRMFADSVPVTHLSEIADCFIERDDAARLIQRLSAMCEPWRGELHWQGPGASDPVLVALRADVIPGSRGIPLGLMLLIDDRSANERVARARAHLERSLRLAAPVGPRGAPPEGNTTDSVLATLSSTASLTAMDIDDSVAGNRAEAAILELENATRRAAQLRRQILRLSSGWEDGPPDGELGKR
jgi:light-regulated signal transduction histidine kinase (bacteriophytochrome)